MKKIVKQIFNVFVDIILSICWGGMIALNSVYCANANEHRWGFIVPIVFSSILLIFNIVSMFVDARELNNLCNLYDDKLKQTMLAEKEVQNGEDKSYNGHRTYK